MYRKLSMNLFTLWQNKIFAAKHHDPLKKWLHIKWMTQVFSLVYEDTRSNRGKKVSHQLQHKLYSLLEPLIENVNCVATHDIAFSLYWVEQNRVCSLDDFQLDAQNSYLFTYNAFINILYMFRALPCSSSGGLRRKCIYAASGIVTVSRW